jgi:TPR repeat protein
MSEVIKLSTESDEAPKIHYGGERPVSSALPILIVLLVVVGFGSAVAWFCGDFSLEDRALRGEPKALYLLGKRYFDSALSPRDYERAAGLIRKAADQGYPKAQTGLGLLYENGLGVPRNYGEALKWFRRAADQGFSVAQNELGVMYAKGKGVPRNLAEAAKWCRLAASQGSEIAKKNLELAEVAACKTIPELSTAEKRSYKRAVLRRVEADGITVSYSPVPGGFGLAKLKLENLPSDLRQLCNCSVKQGTDADSAYSQIGAIATPL